MRMSWFNDATVTHIYVTLYGWCVMVLWWCTCVPCLAKCCGSAPVCPVWPSVVVVHLCALSGWVLWWCTCVPCLAECCGGAPVCPVWPSVVVVHLCALSGRVLWWCTCVLCLAECCGGAPVCPVWPSVAFCEYTVIVTPVLKYGRQFYKSGKFKSFYLWSINSYTQPLP